MKPIENAVRPNAKTRCGNTYKTCRQWRLWGPFFENCHQIIKKHYLEKVSATRFQNVGKPYKTNGKRGFSKFKKRVAQTLIKPVGNEDLGASSSKIALKMIKQALPREGFRNVFSKRRKPLWNQRNTVSPKPKPRCGNPSETCRTLWSRSPFSNLAFKMIKKHCLEKVSASRFQNVGEPYETNGKRGFSKYKSAPRKPL